MMCLLTTTAMLASGPAHGGDGVDDREVRVVTWNAWGLPAPIARARRDRLPRIAEWLDDHEADVAGLQEVWRGAVRMISLVRPHVGSRKARDSGLALVTPHPVSHLELHTYEASRGVDSWKGKGLLDAEVDIDGKPLQVAITHLQAGGSARHAAVREAQIDELLERLGEADRPVLLMGDFNLHEDQPADERARERLEHAGFVDVASHLGSEQPTHLGAGHRFDRIYVRDGDATAVEPAHTAILGDAAALSDHLPVAATVALRHSEG